MQGDPIVSNSYGNSAQVRVGAGRLTLATGFSDAGSALYLQLHDSAAAPAAGAVPFYSMLVPAGGTYSWAPAANGRTFVNGLWVGCSSTPDTYTASAGPVLINIEGVEL